MLAIKGLLQRYQEGSFLGIINCHPDPGRSLQQGQMTSHRQNENSYQKAFGSSGGHDLFMGHF